VRYDWAINPPGNLYNRKAAGVAVSNRDCHELRSTPRVAPKAEGKGSSTEPFEPAIKNSSVSILIS